MAGAANYTTEARRDYEGWEDEKLGIGESYAATRRQLKQVRFNPLANPRSSPHPKLPRAGSIPPDDNESHDRPGLVTLGSKRGGNSADTEGRRGTDSETPEFREELMTSVEDPITTISAEQFEKWLLMLMPYIERMITEKRISIPEGDTGGRFSEDGRAAKSPMEKKQQHELEKIRATEQYGVPVFDMGRHLKDATISLSVL
ncbi:hypothetical protein Trisim1_010268 [Trichoderma cf. simile WF8]